jgi:hypothetical protein
MLLATDHVRTPIALCHMTDGAIRRPAGVSPEPLTYSGFRPLVDACTGPQKARPELLRDGIDSTSRKDTAMLTKDVLDAQTTIELPAREMMAWVFVDVAHVRVTQTNLNAQGGFLNLNLRQANNSFVLIGQ